MVTWVFLVAENNEIPYLMEHLQGILDLCDCIVDESQYASPLSNDNATALFIRELAAVYSNKSVLTAPGFLYKNG